VLTAGATLSLALPWLAATLNTDIATLAPLAFLTLVLAGVAWIWHEPLANFAWRLICQGAPACLERQSAVRTERPLESS
jgi:hypothetical protein